jgi:hypothetical protein
MEWRDRDRAIKMKQRSWLLYRRIIKVTKKDYMCCYYITFVHGPSGQPPLPRPIDITDSDSSSWVRHVPLKSVFLTTVLFTEAHGSHPPRVAERT